MNVTNKQVHHRRFGDGVVTGQTISAVTVLFSEEYGEKKFLYPSAFESFLSLSSPSAQEKMDAELQAIYEQLEAVSKKREEEAEERREEERRVLLDQKKSVAKQRALQKRASKKKDPPKQIEQSESEESDEEDDGE